MITINVDTSGLNDLSSKFKAAAAGEFKKALADEVEKGGLELLDLISQEIIARGATDTRNMVSSFAYGKSQNVFNVKGDGLSVEVGSTVDYTSYVNDGHMTRPGPRRRWVEGRHFIEAGERSFTDNYVPKMEDAINKWITDHLGK